MLSKPSFLSDAEAACCRTTALLRGGSIAVIGMRRAGCSVVWQADFRTIIKRYSVGVPPDFTCVIVVREPALTFDHRMRRSFASRRTRLFTTRCHDTQLQLGGGAEQLGGTQRRPWGIALRGRGLGGNHNRRREGFSVRPLQISSGQVRTKLL